MLTVPGKEEQIWSGTLQIPRARESSTAEVLRGSLTTSVTGTFAARQKTCSPILPLQLFLNIISYCVLHTCRLKEAASTTVMSSGVPSSGVSTLERPYLSSKGDSLVVSSMQRLASTIFYPHSSRCIFCGDREKNYNFLSFFFFNFPAFTELSFSTGS